MRILLIIQFLKYVAVTELYTDSLRCGMQEPQPPDEGK